MGTKPSKINLKLLLFVFTILTAVLFFQPGAVQTARGQCDPAVDPACPTTVPGPTCGLPGLPDCAPNPPPSNPPTSTSLPRPTLTKSPTPAPTATPSVTSTPTVTPTVTASVTPTPGPRYTPILKFSFLPTPPPLLMALVPQPNFEAFNVEITQAIQCLNNPNCADNAVRLFVGKPTMVRLYVRLAPSSPWITVSGIGGELCPGVHGVGGCNNPVHSLNTITVTKLKSLADISLFRGDITSTLNFILPANWTYGSFTVYVNMNGEYYPLETKLNDNFITQSFQEYPSQRLDVMFVPVKSRGYLADLNERWAIRDWLALSYPTSNIQVWQMSGYINNTKTYDWNDTSGGCGDGWGALLSDLSWYRGSNPQVFYGMVHTSTLTGSPYGGCGRFSGKVAAGEVNTGTRRGAEVAAQEIGHTMQRNHAPGCGAGSPDENYPNQGATLDEYGVDVVRNQVYIPNLSFDYMGYCGGVTTIWTSLYTYSNIASLLPDGVYVPGGPGSSLALKQPGPTGFGPAAPVSFHLYGAGLPAIRLSADQPAAVPNPASAQALYLVGSGFVSPLEVSLDRGFFLLGADSVDASTPEAGPYAFELLDAQGSVLSSLPFRPLDESNDTPGNTGSFHLAIPWVEGAKGYQINYNGTVIASQTADPHRPSVESITSTGGSHWPNTGTISLSWRPVYLGSNPLQYLVQYSRDGGISWSMLAVGLDQPALDVEAALLAGSPRAQVRVYVSDGFNTGMAVSTAFTVDDKAPDVHIGWTGDGTQVTAGSPVFLDGAATDPQDGPISGSGLHWLVDGGPLGDGDSIITSALGEGEHVITLSATNTEGVTGTASLHLTVLPPAPRPPVIAELSPVYRLLLWAIIPAGILLVALAMVLFRRKSHRRAG